MDVKRNSKKNGFMHTRLVRRIKRFRVNNFLILADFFWFYFFFYEVRGSRILLIHLTIILFIYSPLCQLCDKITQKKSLLPKLKNYLPNNYLDIVIYSQPAIFDSKCSNN